MGNPMPEVDDAIAVRLRSAMAGDTARDPRFQRRFDVVPLAGAPAFPLEPAPGLAARPAAVLAIVVAEADQAWVVLTRRADDLPEHAGQISLPGGGCQAGDVDAAATALRETGEELGIGAAQLELIGSLAPVYIPPTNYLVTPFVALARGRLVYQPRVEEVAEVIELPLDRLLDPSAITEQRWQLRGQSYLVPHYLWRGHRIWGATARILGTLAAALQAVDSQVQRITGR